MSNPFDGADKADGVEPVKQKTKLVMVECPANAEFIVACGMTFDGKPDFDGAVELKRYPLPPINSWYPKRCPITGRPFFMLIEHPKKGMVPTYGGPLDSYTIPEMEYEAGNPIHEQELFCEQFDHDDGCWKDELILVSRRVIRDDDLMKLEEKAENEILKKIGLSPSTFEAIRLMGAKAGQQWTKMCLEICSRKAE